jgi:O-antigen ligase
MLWGAVAACALTLVMADSGGAFASTALLVVAPYVFKVYQNASPLARPRIFLVYSLAAIALIFLFPILLSFTLTILGKDQTLTGRVPLWQPMLASALERPLQGFGYSTGFAYTVALELNGRTGLGLIPNAQNGYLDTLLNLGLIGLSIIMFAMIRAFRTALNLATNMKPLADAAWQILPFLLMLFYFEVNTVEAWMIEPNNIMVIVFVMVIAAIRSIQFEGEMGERRRTIKMTDGQRRAALYAARDRERRAGALGS